MQRVQDVQEDADAKIRPDIVSKSGIEGLQAIQFSDYPFEEMIFMLCLACQKSKASFPEWKLFFLNAAICHL